MSHQFSLKPLPNITVEQLAERLKGDTKDLQLFDVREPEEVAIASIEGFINLPLSQYDQWSKQIATEFDPHAETLVLCHHGIRSAHMCQWLSTQGFTNVKNISGGIDAFSQIVDPSIPRY